MRTFGDFLCWYNNEDDVPILEAMQKMVDFYHKKGIDMLMLEFNLPIGSKNGPHKSTSAKFYPFTESGKEFLEKLREDMVDGPSFVLINKTVMDETFFGF